MAEPTLKQGVCPKCGSNEVYTNRNRSRKSGPYGMGHTTYYGPMFFPDYAVFEDYICIRCGFTESYITDPKALEKIVVKWTRVDPNHEDRKRNPDG